MLTFSLIYLTTCLIFFILIMKGAKYPRKFAFKLALVSLVWWIAIILYYLTME